MVVSLGAHTGNALRSVLARPSAPPVRDYPTDTGPADYVRFVNRIAVGVIIKAKRDEEGANITAHERQTERYANATLKWRKDKAPLPFLFESTGQIIHVTDGRDPSPCAREIFHFFKPETLEQWLAQPDTLRRRLKDNMPALPQRNLRLCQVSVVTGNRKRQARARAAHRPHQPRPDHLQRLRRAGRRSREQGHSDFCRLHCAAQNRDRSAIIFLPVTLCAAFAHLQNDRRPARTPEPPAADADD